jgi:hypothetical protein
MPETFTIANGFDPERVALHEAIKQLAAATGFTYTDAAMHIQIMLNAEQRTQPAAAGRNPA